MRAPLHRLASLALVFATGCGDALAPLPSEGPPAALELEVFSWPGFGETVHLVGDTVLYARRPDPVLRRPGATSRHVPTAAEWGAFWQAVRDAGVRRWPRECRNADVLDGGGFRYTLVWDGARKAGTYGNSYPTRSGFCSDDDYAPFTRFHEAVRALARAPADVELHARP